MKNVFASIAIGCALAISASAYAAGEMGNMDMSGSGAKQAGEAKAGMSHGEIRKVDAAAGKLTIKHGPLENLGMDAMTMAYNSTPHSSTGMTPFRLMHSRCEDPELPTDLLYGREPTDVAHVACPVKYVEGQRLVAQQISARVAQTLRRSAVLQKRDHARGGLRLVEYNVNDEVWWYYPPHANRKLGVPWLGPFTVVGVNKPGNTVKICGLGRLQWVHASSLKHVLRARNGDLVNSPYRLPRAT